MSISEIDHVNGPDGGTRGTDPRSFEHAFVPEDPDSLGALGALTALDDLGEPETMAPPTGEPVSGPAVPEPPQESIYDWVHRIRGGSTPARPEPGPAMDLTRPVRGRSGRELAAPVTPSPAAYVLDEYGVPIDDRAEGAPDPQSGEADARSSAKPGRRGLFGRRRK